MVFVRVLPFAKSKTGEHDFRFYKFETELQKQVSEVKQLVADSVGDRWTADDFELTFLCKKLEGATLSDCQLLLDHHTVYAVRKKVSSFNNEQQLKTADESPLVSAADVESVLTRWQTALHDSLHRNLLMKVLSNQHTIDSLIGTTPGLKSDSTAQKLLRDPYLLMHWLSNANAVRLMGEHPSLVEASQQILSSLHAEASRLAVQPGASMLVMEQQEEAAVEENDDDDNFADNDQPPRGNGPPVAQAAAAEGITAQHLAAAIARATTNREQQQERAMRRPTPSSAANTISGDALRAAIQRAIVPTPRANFDEATAQLESMGFTNAEENLRALRAANGNLEAALEWIVNERERAEQGLGLD